MTARDHRGRFVSADEHAATRLLEAAVREARRRIARPHLRCGCTACIAQHALHRGKPSAYVTTAVVVMLAEATRSADLLLREARRG